MRIFTTLFSLLIVAFSMAQNSSLTVLNPSDHTFFVVLNGIRQNTTPQTNVKVSGLVTGSYEVKLIFADGKTGDIGKKLVLNESGDYLATIVLKGKHPELKFLGTNNGRTAIPQETVTVPYRPTDQLDEEADEELLEATDDWQRDPVHPATFNSVADFTKTYDAPNKLSDDLHQKAYTYFSESDWKELETLFSDNSVNGGWPPNRGFIRSTSETLMVGTRIDRYGGYIDQTDSLFHDKGTFVSPMGATFGSRALPGGTLSKPYTKYVVVKEIPNVNAGEAIPWFGQEGMGIQYELPETIDVLIAQGYIEKLD